MRVVRDQQYKLIWNIAYPLPYPFASDFHSQQRTRALAKMPTMETRPLPVRARPQFELFDIASDPDETTNLAESPGHLDILNKYKKKMKQMQKEMEDPWIMKWDYE